MKTLIKNISSLIGILPPDVKCKRGEEMSLVESLENAWLLIEGDHIDSFGTGGCPPSDKVIDAAGGMVMPSFCDSHTHIVYAGSREGEFLDKINGLSYEEIARRGGGILNSSDLLKSTDEDELFAQALRRLDEVLAKGTGALEVKSGYGLSTEGEIKSLRIIKRLKESRSAVIKSTFLGAHAVGRGYCKSDYVRLVCEEMMALAEGLADFVDVFCD